MNRYSIVWTERASAECDSLEPTIPRLSEYKNSVEYMLSRSPERGLLRTTEGPDRYLDYFDISSKQYVAFYYVVDESRKKVYVISVRKPL